MHQLELTGLSTEGTLFECMTWLIDHDLDCKKPTREMHAGHARNLYKFFGNDRPISSIRYPDLKKYYEEETKRGISRETVRKRLYTLKMAMQSAQRREVMKAPLPPWIIIKQKPRKRDRFWTLQEWEAADRHCDDEEFRIWVACGFWTGMHTSDLNRFRWQDIDLFKNSWIRRCTKSDVPAMVLPLPARFQKILVERYGRVQPHWRDLVAGRDMGHPHRTMEELCSRAGVRDISPIGLRHSCVTFLFESGCSPKFVQDWMGHTTQRMTQNVYLHATEKSMNDNIAAVNAR